MNFINPLILFIYFFSLSIIIIVILSKKVESVISIFKLKNYESYIAVLEYHMKKAYDIIYKDQILIYSLESTSPSPELLSKAMKDYLNLTLKMLGPFLKEEYIHFYGNVDTLLFNIIEYFNNNIENDEIKKASTNNLMMKDNTDLDQQM